MSRKSIAVPGRSLMTTISASVGIAMVLGGCGGDATRPDSIVRDSAGVTLVEMERAAWGPGDEWRVAPEPTLTMGGDTVAFDGIVGVVALDDGGLAVLDRGSGRLRWFNASGAIVAETGGLGEGPEEFRRPAALRVFSGDTLMVWDAGAAALSLYVDGAQAARYTLPLYAGGAREAPIPLADGILAVPTRTALGSRALTESGRYRLESPVLGWRRGAEHYDTLAVVPGDEVMTMELGGRPAMGVPPFGERTVMVSRKGQLVVGDGAVREDLEGGSWLQVDVRHADGSLVARYRAPSENGPITDADRAWYFDKLAEASSGPMERQVLPLLEQALIFPDRLPAYSGLVVDAEGAVWLRTGRDASPLYGSNRWTVLSAAGTLLGTLMLPTQFEPLAIGSSRMLGVWRDGLGVEQVRVYAIVRSY